jgi:hypothetical protein
MKLELDKVIDFLFLSETVSRNDELLISEFIEQIEKTMKLDKTVLLEYLEYLDESGLVKVSKDDRNLDLYRNLREGLVYKHDFVIGLSYEGQEIVNKLKGNGIKDRLKNHFKNTGYGVSIDILRKKLNELVLN